MSENNPKFFFNKNLCFIESPWKTSAWKIFLLFRDFVAKNDMTVLYTKALVSIDCQKQNCKTLKKKKGNIPVDFEPIC